MEVDDKKIGKLIDENMNLSSRLEKAKECFRTQRTQIEMDKNTIVELNKKLEDSIQELKQAKEAQDKYREESEKKVEKYAKLYNEKVYEIDELQVKLSAKDEEISHLTSLKKSYEIEIDSNKKEIEGLIEKAGKMETTVDKLSQCLNDVNSQVGSILSEIN